MLGIGLRTPITVRKEARASGGVLSTPYRKGTRNYEKKRRSAQQIHTEHADGDDDQRISERTDSPSLKAWTLRRLLRKIGLKRQRRH